MLKLSLFFVVLISITFLLLITSNINASLVNNNKKPPAVVSTVTKFSPEVIQAVLARHRQHKKGYISTNKRSPFYRPQEERVGNSYYHPIRDIIDNSVMGGWLGANANFFKIANPLFNTIINNELTNFTYPEFNTSKLGIHVYLNNITVTDFVCDNCVTLGLGNSYMSLDLNQLSMNLALSYEATALFIKSSGTCTPSVQGMDLSAQISFAAPVQGRPQIKISNTNLDINSLSLNCDGGAGHIANAMADIFKFALGDIMNDILNIAIANEINFYLVNMTLSYNVGSWAMIDFELVPSQSFITNSDISLGVAGVVVPQSNPNIVFPFPAPQNLKSQCFGGGMLNVGLSTYSFQTALYTMFIGGQLSADFPGIIKAGDLKLMVPGFAEKLGDDALLNVTLTAQNWGSVQTSPANQDISLSITLNITISGGQGTFYVMQVNANGALGLTASGGTQAYVNIQIPTLALSNPQVLNSNVGGQISGPLVVALLNGILADVILRPLNDFLSKHGLPLPAIYGFEAQNPKIIYNDDSICIQSNIAPVA